MKQGNEKPDFHAFDLGAAEARERAITNCPVDRGFVRGALRSWAQSARPVARALQPPSQAAYAPTWREPCPTRLRCVLGANQEVNGGT